MTKYCSANEKYEENLKKNSVKVNEAEKALQNANEAIVETLKKEHPELAKDWEEEISPILSRLVD